jgi:hypothetical protein
MKRNVSRQRISGIGGLLLLGGITLAAQEKITVRKMGDEFAVRSEFSPTHDLVIRNFRVANEGAYLVPKNLPLKDYRKGKMIHLNSDEYPATGMTILGYLSGNHGSRYCRTLLIPDHGLTEADIGGKVTAKDGYVFIIMQIQDKDNILIHPLGSGSDFDPKFRAHSTGALSYKGKPLPFQKSTFTQMYPLNRITDYRLLADGKTPVPEDTDVVCGFVDLVFVHDVISPNAAVRSVMENPGRKPSPEWIGKWQMMMVNTPELRKKYADYMKLSALVTYSNTFRFEARGANVVYRKALFHSKIKGIRDLGVMYGWCGGIADKKDQLFYIPKMKPIRMKGKKKDDPALDADFTAGYLMPKQTSTSHLFTGKDLLDPEDVPDRFIRVTGNGKPELGIALGYSLISGNTAKANKGAGRDQFYFFWHTKKMYPFAYSLNESLPGQTFETICYRQYFNPQLEPDATSFYWHREGNSWLVYLDFHKELKDKLIRLPKHLAGKKIAVVEKTPSLTLHTEKTVPEEGIRLDVAGKHGYLVLKLD